MYSRCIVLDYVGLSCEKNWDPLPLNELLHSLPAVAKLDAAYLSVEINTDDEELSGIKLGDHV